MDAANFVACLRASNPIWHEDDGDPPRWVFRGHRNVTWRLKPRAWRTSAEGNPLHAMIGKLATAAVEDNDNIKPETPLHRALAWTHAEKIVLNEFRRIGWHMGFEVEEPDSSFSMDLNYGPSIIDDTRQEPDSYSPFLSCADIGVAQITAYLHGFWTGLLIRPLPPSSRRKTMRQTPTRVIFASGR
jgi:hypothetical protein